MSLVNIAHNAKVAKLVTTDESVIAIAQETLSYVVEGAMGWTGRSSFYSRMTHTFPAGFVHLVQKAIEAKGHTVRQVRHPLPAPLGPESPKVDEFGNDDPRYDFQLRALRQVERHGRGIVQVATGGGKSKIAKLIIARYKRMSLFLTTRGILLYQMKDQLDEIGIKNGVIGDGLFQPNRAVNLGMVQTIVQAVEEPNMQKEVEALVAAAAKEDERARKTKRPSRAMKTAEIARAAELTFARKTAERNRMLKLLSMVEVVIGEEAHEVGGESYYKILQHCTNAHIRVALTATPFMRADAADNMRLMGAFGPILIQVTEQLLIDRGILAQPQFVFRRYKPHPKLYRSTNWQRGYQMGIVECVDRNKDIVDFTKKAKAHGLPTLILVQRKDHGKLLEEMLLAQGVRARFIQGADDNAERKRTLKQLAAGEIDAIIGTTVLDVGVDVPAIGLVILAGGGKAEVALRQRIGRGLRAKKHLPNYCFVLDFNDGVNSHIVEHAAQRRGIIEGTPGFAERILPGQDFDWSIFAASKIAA